MRRLLTACTALILFAALLRADDPPPSDGKPTYYLKPDGTVEARVAKVESDVEKLKAEVAELKRQAAAKTIAESGPGALGSGPKTFPLKPVANPPVQTQRVQVCEYDQDGRQRCRIVEVPVGGSAAPYPPAACDGPACVNGACVSGDCPNGVCVTGSCGSASYAPADNGGWYFGKNLGRPAPRWRR